MSNVHTALYWKSFIVYLQFNHKQIMGKTFIQTKHYLEKETETLTWTELSFQDSSYTRNDTWIEERL